MARSIALTNLLLPALLFSLGGASSCVEGEEDTGSPTDATVNYLWFQDSDSDGYGDPSSSMESTTQPTGYVDNNDDCDDSDPNVNPAATELCDGVDNNCDGEIDEYLVAIYYQDLDGDGWGDSNTYEESCEPISGYVEQDGDCDDSNPDVYPGATEVCDALDNDCNGEIDDDAVDAGDYWVDADLDGFGTPEKTAFGCPTTYDGLADNDLDCDDSDATINPDADEYCDGVDNDCDDEIDESSAVDATEWCVDGDGDGYGDPKDSVASCEEPTEGPPRVADCSDCLDTDSNVNPGADEICGNEADDDCDGEVDEKDCI